MTKKEFENKRNIKKKFIIWTAIIIAIIGIVFYKPIKIKMTYNEYLKKYDYITSFSYTGYQNCILTIKVNNTFNDLPQYQKKEDLNNIYRIISLVNLDIYDYDSTDIVKLVTTQKLIVINADKTVNKYNACNIKDLGEYEELPVIESGSSSDVESNNIDAWVAAKHEVKARLKSPSSAKFPMSYTSPGVDISNNGSQYTVSSFVDADNSFGASVRTYFTVVLDMSGDSSYTVISVDIHE